jgi:hypothetical protein
VTIEARIAEARALLSGLGMDAKRQNLRSARVLLSLLDLKPGDPWSSASAPLLGIQTIMDRIEDRYDFAYKTGSREQIRRQTLHQFVEAHLVVLNPDNPLRAINSRDNAYQITDEALDVIRKFGTAEFAGALVTYLDKRPGLKALYAAERNMERIPVTFGETEVTLSPGGQNVLLKAMVEEFCPRFTPGGEVLYIGDAGDKLAFFKRERLAELGVTVDDHGKLPDLVVYLPEQGWLVLLEAASSHGPVDSKRHGELAGLFAESTAGLVYVSCFPDRSTFRRYVADIAWETEVWCADHPTHMVHFNGERFLGPYT